MNDTKETNEVRDYWANKVEDWSQWAVPMAKFSKGMNKPLLDALNIQADSNVLDLASGLGEPAFSAAKLSGPNGLTIATDLVPEMLRALNARSGSDIMEYSAADMQALPFTDNSFDHISCRFGIMFVPDQQAAINECFRVNKSKGNIAFLVWGEKKNQRIFNIIESAIKEYLHITTDHDFSRIFSLHDDKTLATMLTNSGYHIDQNMAVEFNPIPPENVNFWKPQMDMSFGHLLQECNEGDLKALDKIIEGKIQEFKLEAGGYQMKLQVRLVSAHKP